MEGLSNLLENNSKDPGDCPSTLGGSQGEGRDCWEGVGLWPLWGRQALLSRMKDIGACLRIN